MANIISVSLDERHIKELQHIKVTDGLGASSVMKVGIAHILNKPRIQAEQELLKEENKTLSQKIQKLAKRIYELESGQNDSN